jgi:hypothetical protein
MTRTDEDDVFGSDFVVLLDLAVIANGEHAPAPRPDQLMRISVYFVGPKPPHWKILG